MPHDPYRPAPSRTPALDPGLRELLTFLRDTFRDAAHRLDHYLGAGPASAGNYDDEPRPVARPTAHGHPFDPRGTRMPLESLREEARQISHEATDMDPAELRLRIEAVTAETRALQNRAQDPEDKDIAAKILRALTAIVSEHRPGHVYGLARHHQADWDEVGRRARHELATGGEAHEPDERE